MGKSDETESSHDFLFEIEHSHACIGCCSCYWHGHQCHLTKGKDKQFKTYNEIRKCSMRELREETAKNSNYLRHLGYTVVEMYECEWQEMKAKDKTLQRFISTNFRRRLDKKSTMSEAEILAAVTSGELFGMVEVDIEVPPELKDHFAEMPPIFKNVDIRREDIGEHMREFAEANNLMSQPRRSLIGSYFRKKILLATPLLQWYLSHGLKVTKVYQVIQYWPDNCFLKFGKDVSDARRAGDADPDKAIIADTMKLLGKS